MNISSDAHVVILGAGITGLSLAWELQKRCRVTLLEKSGRAGGWIQTIRKDGFLFEQGPRNFRGVASLQFVEKVGLQDQILYADPSAKIRYLYYHQALQQLPNSLWGMFRSPLMKGIRGSLFTELFRRPIKNEETIYQFFCRRFNSLVAERFVDPFVSGIYAGDVHQLSLQACFPYLHELESQYGSIVKGTLLAKKGPKIPMFSLKGGMETLINAIEQQLSNSIQYHTEVQEIIPQGKKVVLKLHDQTTLEADHLFCAIPGQALSALIPQLAPEIEKIPYASMNVINLGYRQDVLKRKGFGYLVPSKEHEDVLGVVWDSSVFPEQNTDPQQTRLTVMMGGMSRPHLCELPIEKLIELALTTLERHLGIAAVPDTIAFKLCKQAIPQYVLGYPHNIKRLKEKLKLFSPQIHILGPLLDGVGINDCLQKTQSSLL